MAATSAAASLSGESPSLIGQNPAGTRCAPVCGGVIPSRTAASASADVGSHGSASVVLIQIRRARRAVGQGVAVVCPRPRQDSPQARGDWTNQVPTLAAAGYRVLTFDARARGRSTWGDLPPSIRQQALDAVGLLDHLGIGHADVVGWSDGGNVALELAVNHADRLDRVVVYGANYDAAGNLAEIRFSDEMPPWEALVAIYQRLSPAPERMQESFDFAAANPRNFSEAELGSITVPVLVLDGLEEEFINPEYTKRMATLIPGAQLVLMPGTGHFAPSAHPGAENAPIRSPVSLQSDQSFRRFPITRP